MFNHILFASTEYFYLLLLIPAIIVWYVLRFRKSQPSLRVSSTSPFAKISRGNKTWLYHGLFALRMVALVLLIIALARPQSTSNHRDISVEGIDIVMAMDISGSMLAQDFTPNRIEAAKEVGIDFINGRPNDRIGLVVFSGESFTQCPLTTDHVVLTNLYKELQSGMIEDGTALGDGLATAVNRLKESKAISKVIILLTDGVNNMGSVDPVSAAEIAKLYGVRVYTIGVGTQGYAPIPVQTPFGTQIQNMEVQIDEPLLKRIADMTGAKYFRAVNKDALSNIYKEIDRMEKSKVDVTEFRKKSEEFMPWALAGLILLITELLLRYSVFRRLP
ncbi:MAG: VWA domain-containing protein [Bacteroidetes bacterium]|nr:VWA domain-containing protein [Bacteroidota bacterium]